MPQRVLVARTTASGLPASLGDRSSERAREIWRLARKLSTVIAYWATPPFRCECRACFYSCIHVVGATFPNTTVIGRRSPKTTRRSEQHRGSSLETSTRCISLASTLSVATFSRVAQILARQDYSARFSKGCHRHACLLPVVVRRDVRLIDAIHEHVCFSSPNVHHAS